MSEQITSAPVVETGTSTGEANAAEAIETITSGGGSEKTSGVDELNAQNLDPERNVQESEAAPETAEELKDAVEDAIEEGATEEEVKDMIREFELKVNGKKKKVSIDLNDEKDLVRRLQMAEAGQEAMQSKKELEKMITQELMRAKQNPWDFLQELGLNPDDLAEQRLTEKVEQLQKSPEQIERENLQRELEKARAELKKQQTAAEEAKTLQLQQEASAQLEQEMMEALEKHKNLPKTRKTMRRIADAMLWAMENGYEDVAVEDVIPAVEAEIKQEFNEFIAELPDEMMENYIGKKNLDRLRKKRLAEMKKVRNVEQVKQTTQPPKKKEDESPFKEPGTVRAKDFFRDL